MYIWYDDRFTQMKRSNAHEVTLRAVLVMLFLYLCPHLVRRQFGNSMTFRYTVNFHYMNAFRDSARIFRIADIIGYIEVFCNFSVVDCDLLQSYCTFETTDAWSLRQLQLASAFGVRLPSVFRVDWTDSWLPTYQMSGGRRLLWVLRPQSVEPRQAASSQIVHLNIK